jgi:hypothetical protein
VVEHQPSKLRVAGSSPVSRWFARAHVAQSEERFLGKEEVTGSNPVMGSPNISLEIHQEVDHRYA